MNFTTILNSIGLIFDIVGAILVFKYVPNFWSLDDRNVLRLVRDDDYEKKEKFSKIGLVLIIIGFVFQFLSNLSSLAFGTL